jgi:N-acetylmuramic acid 6-phosphate (MurNAc-6-P) etherase
VLDAAGGRVKPAIVMARRNVSLEEAERLIADADGRLRAVLGDPPEVTP